MVLIFSYKVLMMSMKGTAYQARTKGILLLPLLLPESILVKEEEKTGTKDYKTCAEYGEIGPAVGFNPVFTSQGDG